MRTKLFTRLLNFLGLTLAVVTFAVIMVQVKWDATYNKAYPDSDRLYRVELCTSDDGKFYPITSRPIIESIRQNGLQEGLMETLAFDQTMQVSLSPDPKAAAFVAKEQEISVSAFSLLGIEITQGQVKDFNDQTQVAISTTLAERLFKGESAVGRTVFMKGFDKELEAKVTAVYKPMPRNVMYTADILLPLGDAQKDNIMEWSYACIVKRPEAVTEEKLKESILNAVNTKVGALTRMDEAIKSEQLRLTKLHDAHFTPLTSGDPAEKGSRSTMLTLITMAFVVLIVALVNFMNISMAAIPRHIREINTRKILGSSRTALVWRQLRVSIAVAVLSVAAAALLMQWISTTPFAAFVSDTVEPLRHWQMMLMILALTIIVSIIAGVYPAVYSTSFQPAVVLKGSFSHSASGRRLRWTLVGAQLVMSMVLMLFALFVGVQTRYMKSHDKGFQSDAVVVTQLAGNSAAKGKEIKQHLLKNAQIADVTFADGNLVNMHGTNMSWGREYKGQQISFGCLPVATNFLDFFGIKMAAGRGFRESDNNVASGTFIFNEAAARNFGIKAGEQMTGWNGEAEIVGIAKNFNFRPLQYNIEPIALIAWGTEQPRPMATMYVKMGKQADFSEVSKLIEKEQLEADASLTPDNIYIEFFDEYLGRLYKKEQSLGQIISVACIVSVLISIIGIIGLVHLDTQFRRKEIAVRRVVGASIGGILAMFTSVYAKICGLCFVVAVPIAYAIMRSWLGNYPYQSAIPLWIFALTLAATLAIVVLTVSLTSLRAATRNPAESIKTE